MQGSPFIFSRKLKFRFGRHLVFWLVSLLSQGTLSLLIPSFFHNNNAERMFQATGGQLLFLPGQLLLVYSLLYFIIPRFLLQARYREAFVWLLIICIATGVVTGFCQALGVQPLLALFFDENHRPYRAGYFALFFQNGFLGGLESALIVGGFATSIKLTKYWYEKEYRNTILQKEKLNAELQSLKAQLHPHFLFNTLNNIYSITQNTSAQGSEMIARLSDLLRYILYECDKPVVPLQQELTMLKDYIALEKVRYGTNLDIDVSFPAVAHGLEIAPLLLLPLAENCFKHGSSKIASESWIQISAVITGQTLAVKFINSKPLDRGAVPLQYGLGLTNVQKRLEHLYPGKNEFSIISEADVFIVNLKLDLDKVSTGSILQENELHYYR